MKKKYGSFNRRKDADRLFKDLKYAAYLYNYVTEADLYDLMDIKYYLCKASTRGWTSRELDELSYPVKVGENGFYLELPEPTHIDNMVFNRPIRYDYDSHMSKTGMDIVIVTDEIINWKDTLKLVSELVNENNDRDIHITIK